jgi:CheY-like chemotaxis protein
MSNILVIDDSPSALETIAMMLAGAGYQVCTCADGKPALQMLKHEAFDLILTDIFMPEQDGLEVIREAHQLRPSLPIIAMSGIIGEGNMLAVAKYLGARQLLIKPFSNADLLTAVGAALGTSTSCPATPEHEAPPLRDTVLQV